jgi:Tol biopolymer transport system component
LWRTDVDTGKEEAFVAGIDAELWPHISPTGKKVVFQSVKNLSQGNNIFSASILVKNTQTDETPTKIAENGFLPVWAPDGNKLAYLQISTNSGVDLKIVDANGGSASTLVSSEITEIGYSLSPYNRVQAFDFDWSPDSSSIAYISNREGLSNLSIVAVDGSGNKLITDNRVKTVYYYCPTWSSDGKLLAYYSKSNSADKNGKSIYRFWVYDAETDSSKSLYETTRLSRLIGWSESDRALHIASTDTFSSLPPKTILSSVSTADGSIRESAILYQAYFYNMHVSPDGKQIGFAANRDGKDDIWIVPAEKKAGKRVTNNNDANLYFSGLAWSADGKSIYFGKQNRFSLLSIITNVPQGAPDEKSD